MQHWQEGRLITAEHEFDNLNDAVEFCQLIKKPSTLRIYNEYNEIVHQSSTIEEYNPPVLEVNDVIEDTALYADGFDFGFSDNFFEDE